MKIGELIAFFVLLAVGWAIHFVMGPSPGTHLIDTHKGNLVPVSDIRQKSDLGASAVHAVLVRQSGNIYRDLGSFETVQDAMDEIEKSFRRAKVDEVRITFSDEDSMAIYRRIYDFTGRAEGKKLAGARLVRVGGDRESWLSV